MDPGLSGHLEDQEQARDEYHWISLCKRKLQEIWQAGLESAWRAALHHASLECMPRGGRLKIRTHIDNLSAPTRFSAIKNLILQTWRLAGGSRKRAS
jgi:hypothetical protein